MTTAIAAPAFAKALAGGPVVVRGGADAKLAHKLMFAVPDDCKFKDFASIKTHAREQRARSREATVDMRQFLFATRDESDYVYIGDESFLLSNLIYKQVSLEAGIPIQTLSQLKAATRIQVLNELWDKIRKLDKPQEKGLLIEKQGDKQLLRAMNGARYERLWDDEVFTEIDQTLIKSGWVPAHPTFNIDPETPVSEREKALIRTDRYSFTFYFTEPKFKAGDGFSDSKYTNDGLTGSAEIARAQGFNQGDTDGLGGLRKGIMVYNGETGHKSFGWQQFLFRNVCSNFNIWDMSEGITHRARHTTSVRESFVMFRQQIEKLAGELTNIEYESLHRAKALPFAKDDEEAIKRLNKIGVTRSDSKAAVEAAYEAINGGDLSIWSIVNGITWHAKELAHEESRVELCAMAGTVLNTALAQA